MRRVNKKKKKYTKLSIITRIFIFLDVFAFIVVAGSFLGRSLIIPKLTGTKTFLAYAIYGDVLVNDEKISYDFDESVTKLNIAPSSNKQGVSNYEKMILTRDPSNNNYKLIKTKIAGYNAYLAVIYDPSTVHLLLSNRMFNSYGLQNMKALSTKYHAKVAINGGRFREYDGGPVGYIFKDGKMLSKRPGNAKGRLIAFDNNNRMRLVRATGTEAQEMGIKDAVEFGPFLIVDGKVQKIKYLISGYHRVGRTIIAQREDGIVLFLVTDVGAINTNAPSMDEIVDKLVEYGAVNAANLDGGASSQMVVEGKLLNVPRNVKNVVIPYGRYVLNGWGYVGD